MSYSSRININSFINWGKNNSIILLFIALSLPIIEKLIPDPTITSIEVVGNFIEKDVYRCFFSDDSFVFKDENSCSFILDSAQSKIIFNKPEHLEKANSFRLGFGYNFIDQLQIDSINIHYSDGKFVRNDAETLFKRIMVLYGIDKIQYTKEHHALLAFTNTNEYSPYAEFMIDTRTYSSNNLILLIGGIILFLTLYFHFSISYEETLLFLFSSFGFFSFFSTILVNNIFVISLCLLAIFFKFSNKNRHTNYIVTAWLIFLFFLKVIWTFLPSANVNTLGVVEKYLSYLVIPLAFMFLPINKSNIKIVFFSILSVSIALFYMNTFSLVLYQDGINNLLNSSSSYVNGILLHFYFTHSSYISFFYILSLISVCYLYSNKYISIFTFIALPIVLLAFTVLSNARVGTLFVLIVFGIFITFKYLKVKRQRNFLMVVFLLVILSAIIIPFTDFISFFDKEREIIWDIALRSIDDNKIFGIGTGMAREVFYSDPRLAESFIPRVNAHNQILNEMMEHGIFFGFSIFLLIIVFGIKAIKENDIYSVLFLVATLIFMTTEVITDRSRGIIFFVSVLSFLEVIRKDIKYTKK